MLLLSLGVILVVVSGVFAWRHARNGAEEDCRRGQTLVQLGMLHEAEQIWRQSMQAYPDDSRPRMALARFLLDRGRYAEAADVYRSVTKLSSVPAHTFCLLGQCEWRGGDMVAALRDSVEETRRDPKCARGHLIAGQIYRRESRANEALAHLSQAAALAPDVGPVRLVYASVLAKTNQYSVAEPILRDVIRKEPLHDEPYYWLGYCLSRDSSAPNHIEEAETQLLRALSIQPADPTVHYELARIYLAKHAARQAQKHAAAAVKLRPHYPDALFTLAQAQRESGLNSAANITLERFRVESDLAAREKSLLRQLAINRRDLSTLLALAEVERKRDNTANARAVLTEATHIAPASNAVRTALMSLPQGATEPSPEALAPLVADEPRFQQ